MKQLNLYMYMIMMMLIMMIMLVMVSVAFVTLMERKILSYIQMRKGPNKLGFVGLMQPISDAIKLLMKEMFFMIKLNYMIYLLSPMFMMTLIFMMWLIYPYYTNLLIMNLGVVYLMCCISLGGYSFMMSGWASNSYYAMLGSIRSLAQSISYEVSLAIIMIMPMFLINELDYNMLNYYIKFNFFLILWPMSVMFVVSIMAELNRTPFDFSEGESELVSGFNIEYMGSGFILIFLSEYASIIFMSVLLMIYFGMSYNLYFYMKVMVLILMIIWLRGTLPRFRYDLLMYLCWLMILPFSLNYLFYMIIFKYMVYN